MRCHLSEGFASARAAIDATLIAAQIIHDRPSQIAYLKSTKPFDKLNRHFKNLIKDGKELPHPLVRDLLALFDRISSFASHADIGSFLHRVRFETSERFVVDYFQSSKHPAVRGIHMRSYFFVFGLILFLFSDFRVDEQKTVATEWREAARELLQRIDADRATLTAQLRAEEVLNVSTKPVRRR